MPYRPSPKRAAKSGQVELWSGLPDSVFEDLGADRQTIAKFGGALVGGIVLPGEGNYSESARTSFNKTASRPKIIVFCDVEQDIRLCLQWARQYGWWAVPRSGGHSTAGYSVNDGMVIDVSRMNGVQVDPVGLTATIGSGANFGTINAVLGSYRLHLPGGICPDVGIAGYMQGAATATHPGNSV
ncbi:MAG: FAD-dependent oxidoreductase [Hyphomicrobiales bacterium]|nr:FAD-dependent oxidoreductase [Hyphomicrobiales bacterium]